MVVKINKHLTNPLRINKPFFEQPTQTTVKVHPFGFLNSTSHRFCWLYIHWLPFWKRRAAASHRWWKLSRRLLCVDRLLRAKCQLLSLFIHAPCHQCHSVPLRPPYFFPTDPDNQRGTEWPPLWDMEGEQTGRIKGEEDRTTGRGKKIWVESFLSRREFRKKDVRWCACQSLI